MGNRRTVKLRLLAWLLTIAMLFGLQGDPVIVEGVTVAVRIIPANPVYDKTTDTTKWGYVYFGSYPQTEVTGNNLTDEIKNASYDENGDAWVGGYKYRRLNKADGDSEYRYFKWERIKWRVLQNDGETLYLMADKGIDCQKYNEEYLSVTWEDSSLRTWLNDTFYHTAFSSREREAIVKQNISNEDNPVYGTDGGNGTCDNIYLLSASEMLMSEYGFCEDGTIYSASRRMQASDYTQTMGVYNSTEAGYQGNCWWWLRTPGSNTKLAVDVSHHGDIYYSGNGVNVSDGAVVPVLHLNLSSDFWYSTDDGSSGDGGSSETPGSETTETESSETPGSETTGTESSETPGSEAADTKDSETSGSETTETESSETAGTAPANPVYDEETDTAVWDYVYFGSYPQTEVTEDNLTDEIINASYDENGDAWVDGYRYRRVTGADANYNGYFGDSEYRYFKWERMKWRVLQNDGNTLYLMSDRGLDCKDYNEEETSTTWEDSTLRIWLNNTFYSTAFSEREQEIIVTQEISNEDNSDYGTDGGNDTSDNVYLLSIGEITNPEYGFCVSANRQLKTSDYAHSMGVYINDGNCYWWLRSPGSDSERAAYVLLGGYIYKGGMSVNSCAEAVVPVLHINLTSDLWYTTDDGSSGDGGSSETPESSETPGSEAVETEASETSGSETRGTESSETPGSEAVETEASETPGSETTGTESSETPGSEAVETEASETPGSETTGTESSETPATERGEPNTQETEKPDTETPVTEKPGTETPESQTAETSASESQNPDITASETQTPITQTPITQTPNTSVPGAQTPNTLPETQASATEQPDINEPDTGSTQTNTDKLTAPKLTVKLQSANSVKLTWKKVSGAKGYIIYRATSKKGKYKKIKTLNKTSYTDKKLKSGKTYYYKIAAYKGSTVGAESAVVSKKVIGKPKAPAQNKPTFNASKTKVIISCKPVKNAKKIEILLSTDGGAFKVWKTVSASKGKASFSRYAMKGHSYVVVMRAYYTQDGIKVYSDYSNNYKFSL